MCFKNSRFQTPSFASAAAAQADEGATRVSLLLHAGAALYVEANADAVVVCNVERLGGKTVKWTHNGEDIALLSRGSIVVFIVSFRPAANTQLQRLNVSDTAAAGIYGGFSYLRRPSPSLAFRDCF